jgi:hypothetical protein
MKAFIHHCQITNIPLLENIKKGRKPIHVLLTCGGKGYEVERSISDAFCNSGKPELTASRRVVNLLRTGCIK